MTNWKVPYTLCSSMDDRHLTTPISRGRGRGGRGKARRGNRKYAAVSHRSQVRPVLESNWERYGEEGLLTADVTKAKTYEDLLQAAAGSHHVSRFQFDDEFDWMDTSSVPTVSLNLDIQAIAGKIANMPLASLLALDGVFLVDPSTADDGSNALWTREEHSISHPPPHAPTPIVPSPPATQAPHPAASKKTSTKPTPVVPIPVAAPPRQTVIAPVLAADDELDALLDVISRPPGPGRTHTPAAVSAVPAAAVPGDDDDDLDALLAMTGK